MVELTRKDIEFFKTEGYLVKRNVLNPELMERARERLWDGAPEGRKRDDPDTWIGPFTPEEENIDKSNNRRGFRWNFREPGGEEWMVQLLATDPNVWADGGAAVRRRESGPTATRPGYLLHPALRRCPEEINRMPRRRTSVPSWGSRIYRRCTARRRRIYRLAREPSGLLLRLLFPI